LILELKAQKIIVADEINSGFISLQQNFYLMGENNLKLFAGLESDLYL
jgi:hypothetical protein